MQEPTNTPEEVEEVVGDAEEDIENKNTPIPKELVPVPDSGPITNDTDFLYNEYYRIPDYTNKYDTDDMLVIGRSKIPGAGLGLFAFVTIEQRNHPGYKHLWIKKKDWNSAKFLLFKGYPPAHKNQLILMNIKVKLFKHKQKKKWISYWMPIQQIKQFIFPKHVSSMQMHQRHVMLHMQMIQKNVLDFVIMQH